MTLLYSTPSLSGNFSCWRAAFQKDSALLFQDWGDAETRGWPQRTWAEWSFSFEQEISRRLNRIDYGKDIKMSNVQMAFTNQVCKTWFSHHGLGSCRYCCIYLQNTMATSHLKLQEHLEGEDCFPKHIQIHIKEREKGKMRWTKSLWCPGNKDVKLRGKLCLKLN